MSFKKNLYNNIDRYCLSRYFNEILDEFKANTLILMITNKDIIIQKRSTGCEKTVTYYYGK